MKMNEYKLKDTSAKVLDRQWWSDKREKIFIPRKKEIDYKIQV
jgi:hypothetical protein